MLRAAKLEVSLYDEVKADTTANRQAFLVVVISGVAESLALALGIRLGTISGIVDTDVDRLQLAILLLVPLVGGIVGWLIWSLLAYWLGTMIFKQGETSASYGGVLRAIGFANSPMVLGFFVFVPYVGAVIALAVSIWVFIATIVALKQALALSAGRAVGLWAVIAIPAVLIYLFAYVLQ